MTAGTGTWREPRELKAWHLAAILVAILVLDVAWGVLEW